MPDYVGALDQGTTSSRFLVFNRRGRVVASDQREHQQIYPQPGWVEHNPVEIWENCQAVIGGALQQASLTASDLVAVGITNQRETVVVWERTTGQTIGNAIVWQDTRTADLCRELEGGVGQDRFRSQTGLPIATYFSAPKIRWLLDHDAELARRADRGELAASTVDSWLTWNLIGQHLTDVTNASRTMLMDIERLEWSSTLADTIGIPLQLMPEIRSSSAIYGECGSPLPGVPLAGILGDQQAALFGQTCFAAGSAKNTYGTGCFLLLNTGTELVQSRHGLLTTVAYRIGDGPVAYALEGSVAIGGAVVQWLRDNLGIIATSAEVEALARTVDDNGDTYFVPAFSGLFAPHWRADARGAIVGLTRYVNKGHLARAALESTAYQTKEVLDAMKADSQVSLTELRVDGGMVVNELLMQFQADLIGVPVVRPAIKETTALGAAYAAGLAVGFWSGLEELVANWGEDKRFIPAMNQTTREALYGRWQQAVQRTLDWV